MLLRAAGAVRNALSTKTTDVIDLDAVAIPPPPRPPQLRPQSARDIKRKAVGGMWVTDQ